MGLYSQFSLLFIGAIFYEVIISECETVASRGNTGLGSFEPLVTFLSTDQYITLFYVYFILKTLLCSLDPKYPLKAHVLQTLSSAWHCWETEEPLRDGAYWEVFRTLRIQP